MRPKHYFLPWIVAVAAILLNEESFAGIANTNQLSCALEFQEQLVTSLLEKNSFIIDRGLTAYSLFLPKIEGVGDLKSLVATYRGRLHVIDASAGEAMTLREILKEYDDLQNATFSAYSYKKPDDDSLETDLELFKERFSYDSLNWDFITKKHLKRLRIKKAQLTLDVIGYAQYGSNLKLAIENLSMITKVGGLIGLGVITETFAPNHYSMRPSLEIVDQYGQKHSLKAYLEAVDGIRIISSGYSKLASLEVGETFFLLKMKESVNAPALKILTPTNLEGAPLNRKYLWVR